MPRGVQQALVGEGHGQLPREGSGWPVQGRNLLGEEGGHWSQLRGGLRTAEGEAGSWLE